MIKITIPGEPRALQRHRTVIVRGKQTQYDPQKMQKMTTQTIMVEQRIASGWPFKDRDGDLEIEVAYSLVISYYCYRPSSMRDLTEHELNLIRHIRKPDLDNLDKYIFDCGNKILWHDDCEIYQCLSEKFWSKQPRTEIIWDGI